MSTSLFQHSATTTGAVNVTQHQIGTFILAELTELRAGCRGGADGYDSVLVQPGVKGGLVPSLAR